MKINKSYWIIGTLILAFLALLPFWLPQEKSLKKRKLDWTPSFKKLETKPYASKALYILLKDLFPEKAILPRTNIFPNDSILLYQAETKAERFNLFYAHLQANADAEFGRALSNFLYFGGNAFIAAEYFSFYFEDAFGSFLHTSPATIEQGVLKIKFLHPKLSTKTYEFPNIINYAVFQVENWQTLNQDETNTFENTQETSTYTQENKPQVIATDQYNNPVLVKVKYGAGNLYACSLPLIFTNFGVLDDKQRDFIAKALSHLPVRDVLWEDEIVWKTKSNYAVETNPEGIKELAFLKKNPPLWWAFWLTLVGVLLFIIFKAKREQRIIPILEKNTNTSLEFAQTIGRLYFNYRDHKNLAEKKILYFLEFLRSTFFISNLNEYPDEATISKIAQKIGVSERQVKQTFETIQNIKSKNTITETELHRLVSEINHLKRAVLMPQKS
ncbi:MAG: homeobox domain-containing protein [Raineya sp.]|nr:homeobox domain-containing protein [Raineya sp.]MDW8296795.1 homeobox domain-containing protein [Raineya sp.]